MNEFIRSMEQTEQSEEPTTFNFERRFLDSLGGHEFIKKSSSIKASEDEEKK